MNRWIGLSRPAVKFRFLVVPAPIPRISILLPGREPRRGIVRQEHPPADGKVLWLHVSLYHFLIRFAEALMALVCPLFLNPLTTFRFAWQGTASIHWINCDSVRFVHCVFNPPLILILFLSTMSTSTTTLQQDEIPGESSSAVLREFTLETVSQMRDEFLHAALSEDPPCVVGVSVGLGDSGPHIRTLALATPGHVFDLSLRRTPSPAQRRILQTLFSKISCLAGFELPYTIVLLAHTIGGDVSGHDLSTVKFGAKPSYMRMPGALIKSKYCSASVGRINERWETRSDTKPLEPNHRVRSWFTAMCECVSRLL